jgi:hypothetical protein
VPVLVAFRPDRVISISQQSCLGLGANPDLHSSHLQQFNGLQHVDLSEIECDPTNDAAPRFRPLENHENLGLAPISLCQWSVVASGFQAQAFQGHRTDTLIGTKDSAETGQN